MTLWFKDHAVVDGIPKTSHLSRAEIILYQSHSTFERMITLVRKKELQNLVRIVSTAAVSIHRRRSVLTSGGGVQLFPEFLSNF
jgi:hypothetical protein